MLEFILIPFIALLASALTLFSGFGLGTLLLPVFAIFFPVDLAVAMTAVVHLLNNLFKLLLLGKHADRTVVLRFGIPAILSALAGALLLVWISDLPPLYSYEVLGRLHHITPVKLIVSTLMIVFGILEVAPRFENLTFDRKYLPAGGIISGFFGGLSGHQGALRSAFLARAGLTKESFIASGVVIACMIDLTRLSVYARHLSVSGMRENTLLIVIVTVSAFVGAFTGTRLLKKITFRTIRIVIAILLFALAAFLGAGII